MKAHGLLRDEIDGRDGGTHRLETLKGLDRNAMLALAGCEEKDKHVTCNGGFKRRHEGDGRLAYPGGGVGEEVLALRHGLSSVREEFDLPGADVVERPRDWRCTSAGHHDCLFARHSGPRWLLRIRKDMKRCWREDAESTQQASGPGPDRLLERDGDPDSFASSRLR